MRGDGFLADVVADWEAATEPAVEAGLRVVNVRTGIVQSARGGTLRLLRPLFAAGLGGRVGSGRQWLSWIGIDDLLDVYHRALYDARLSGPVNAVAPEPVRNADYTKALAGVLHRPALLPVPSLGPRLLLGEQGVPRTRRGRSAGGGRPSSRRWVTDSGTAASTAHSLTSSGTADGRRGSRNRAPDRAPALTRSAASSVVRESNSSWVRPKSTTSPSWSSASQRCQQRVVDLRVELQCERTAEHERL